MQEEKLEKIMNELYRTKAEITSENISLKRGYLLYKKILLIATLFTKVLIDLEKERKDKNKKRILEVWGLLFFSLLNSFIVFLSPPLAIINLLTISLSLKKIKKNNEIVKEDTELNRLITRYADLINNVQEILASKISKLESTEEQRDYTREILETPIKDIFEEQVITMFVEQDNLTLEEFESRVSNEELLKDIAKLTLTKN